MINGSKNIKYHSKRYIYIYSDIKDIQVIDCLSRMLLNSLFKFLDILIYFKKAVLSVNYQSDPLNR